MWDAWGQALPTGLGTRIAGVAKLLPEMPADVIQRTMRKFGTVQEIINEKWSNAYCYN